MTTSVAPSPPHGASKSRRLDIQGLRAVAVLMVVAFHAGLPVPGGFVGVDVFFVISGFVIAGMLHREWEATGRIRFGAFYIRRFKRLTPALALMVTATLIVSSLVLSPLGPQQNVANTAIGAMLLAANCNCWSYWWLLRCPRSDEPPAAHMVALCRGAIHLVFTAVLAFGVALRTTLPAPQARWACDRRAGDSRLVRACGARFWSSRTFRHLLAGWFLWPNIPSLGVRCRSVARPRSGQIYEPLAEPRAQSRVARRRDVDCLAPAHRRQHALSEHMDSAPRRGNASHHFRRNDQLTILTRALSARPMVHLGDCSYSIYLWHWPFIVFATLLWPEAPHAALIAAALSFVPALASYAWVEQPIRSLRGLTKPRLASLVTAVVISPILIAVTVSSVATHIWTPRYESGAVPVANPGDIGETGWHRYVRNHFYPCTPKAIRDRALKWEGILRCQQSKPNQTCLWR